MCLCVYVCVYVSVCACVVSTCVVFISLEFRFLCPPVHSVCTGIVMRHMGNRTPDSLQLLLPIFPVSSSSQALALPSTFQVRLLGVIFALSPTYHANLADCLVDSLSSACQPGACPPHSDQSGPSVNQSTSLLCSHSSDGFSFPPGFKAKVLTCLQSPGLFALPPPP